MYITNTAGCATGGSDEAIQSSKAWTLGQTNALATVYVKYRDEAGNWTACINDTITHDDTDPTLTITNSGWINASNFASYAVTGACNENGRTVIIGGDASGSATCDGTSYSANVNYTPVADSASINVTADMSDEAGNAATQQTVTLGKDIIAPVVSVTNTGWINEDTETTYSVTGTCTDAVSGTASQTVSISGTESATPSCSSGTFTVAVDYSSAAEGANTVTINADISDVAGNAATTSTVTLSKDSRSCYHSYR